MLKDKAKKEYQRDYMKRKRSNTGSNIKPNKNKGLRVLGMMAAKGMAQYPDIIDKLTDPIWRSKLEKICHAFQPSSNPSYSKDVWLGDTNLSVVCDWLECTR